MFAILLCKGSTREKAELFFDLIVGYEGIKIGRDSITWKSSRMMLAIKKLLFFSEIFPKKF